jgi:CelD/BcsL family acetyltransferase involved in cellulose biosynthesis
MKIAVLSADQLTSDHVQAWSRWQRADAALDSPFFRPEYAQAVAAVRTDVKIAVLEEDGEPAGFFPFQHGRWGAGKPIGGRMTDFQGLVGRPGLTWDAEELVRGCGLAAWDFDHLVISQQSFRSHYYATAESPYLNLSGGFDAYQEERTRAGSLMVKQTLRKARKLEREVGTLRFEAHTTDKSVLAALIRWKSEQYLRTKATNVFAFSWTLQLLERVLDQSGEAFRGMMSALYAGPHLVAVHLGLRSHEVMNWWLPTYDRSFGQYSPGLVLLMEFSKAAQSLGIRRIDLGKGDMDYKSRLMSGASLVAEGSVAVQPFLRVLRRNWHRTRAWVRSSPLRGASRVVGRWTRPIRGWLAFH